MTQPVLTLDQEILDDAGFEEEDIVDLPGRISKISWQGADTWEKGKDVPGNPGMTIHSMFGTSSDEERVEHVAYSLGDIRVYEVPKQGEIYRRVTINRMSPAFAHEDLTRTAFVQEVSRELQELTALEEEKELVECEAEVTEDGVTEPCGNMNKPDAIYCDQCGAKLPEDEDDGEEKPGETPAADPATSPAT